MSRKDEELQAEIAWEVDLLAAELKTLWKAERDVSERRRKLSALLQSVTNRQAETPGEPRE